MHTMLLSFLLPWVPEDPNYLSRFNYIISGLSDALNRCPKGIQLSLHYLPCEWNLFRGNEIQIFIDCIDLFCDPATEKSQIDTIRRYLVNILAPMDIDINEMVVRSIDYCKNFIVQGDDTRKLLLKLWDKTHEWFKRAKRIPGHICKTVNNLYWKCEDYYNVQIYDKETERKDKGKKPEQYEFNLMRLEYQIREKHINYWYQKGRPHTFDAWTDWDLRAKYLSETERLFFSGDFYCPTRAKTKLNQAVRAGTIKPVIAERIYRFMVDISRKGVDFAFSKTSKPTAEKYIEILSSLGVNPIPIPRNKGIPILENPLRAFYEGGCVR